MERALQVFLILFTSLVILVFLYSSDRIPPVPYKVRDLSQIKIPEYSTSGLFPIEKKIEEIVASTKTQVQRDIPKNPQYLLLKWSEYKLYIDPLIGDLFQPDDLVYLITVDVTRKPEDLVIPLPPTGLIASKAGIRGQLRGSLIIRISTSLTPERAREAVAVISLTG